MKLYHFTASRFIPDIKRDGLTLGMFPLLDDYGRLNGFLKPCQWLTDNRRPEQQSWATNRSLDYDRTEVRLTISIPKYHRMKLARAIEYVNSHHVAGSKGIVTDWPGHEHWYMYFGNIPRGWIREIEKVGDEDDPDTGIHGVRRPGREA